MRVYFPNYNTTYYNPSYNSNKGTIKKAMPENISKDAFFNELCMIQNYNVSFFGKTTPKPIYAIDEEMNCLPFPSASRASKELNIPTASIFKCLSGDSKYAGSYCFVYAENVDIVQKDGTKKPDDDKIKQIYEIAKAARIEDANAHRKPIFAMDENFNMQRFDSITIAAKELELSRANISACLSPNSSRKTAGGFFFFKAEEIEIKDDETGKIDYDYEKLEKIKEIAKAAFANSDAAEKIPLYAIYKDGTYKRFDNLTDAIEKLKISFESIKASLSGDKKFIKGYCFIKAEEIETIKEDGTVEKDEEKIKELAREAQIAFDNDHSIKGKAVYAVSVEDLKCTRFDKSSLAAKELTLSLANISNCLAERKLSTGGYMFFPAFKIETDDENSESPVDDKKLQDAIENLKKNVAANKASKKMQSQGKSAKPKTSSNSSAQKCPQTKPDIQITEQKVTDNEQLPVASETASKPSLPTLQPKKKKTSTGKTALKTETPKQSSPQKEKTSRSKQKKASKYDVLKQPLQSRTDDKKIRSLDSLDKKLKKKYLNLGKIYAMKSSGDYKEFKNLEEACNFYNVDFDVLYSAIKKNITCFGEILFTSDSDA